MLSKLRHSGAANQLKYEDRQSLALGLQTTLGSDLADLQPMTGGTLGVLFSGVLAGKKRCFKTNGVQSGDAILIREHAFLQATLGDRADAVLIRKQESGAGRIWLHMKELQRCGETSPVRIEELVGHYETALRGEIDSSLVPSQDNIYLLLDHADLAIKLLHDHNLISRTVQAESESRLTHLRSISGSWDLRVCHGDLGPANVLCDDQGPAAIDWEDAFWGIEGYDYLYWLTFFSNRRWLSPASLGRTPWGKSTEVSIMVMILLLKCMLSVRDRSYFSNKISFDTRLMEVSELD